MITPTTDDTLLNGEAFISTPMAVEPQWIDYNGHLNMAYYNVLFDRCVDQLWARFGMGHGYIQQRNKSTFTAECHVRYVRELHLNDPVQVSVTVVGYDRKRIHTYQELIHAEEGWLSATSENMSLHMDMDVRKVGPFPDDVLERIQAVAAAHQAIPRSNNIGRRIAMPPPKA